LLAVDFELFGERVNTCGQVQPSLTAGCGSFNLLRRQPLKFTEP
jgi:hypothetical protein